MRRSEKRIPAKCAEYKKLSSKTAGAATRFFMFLYQL
jgi:hypothetical protein